MYPSVYAHIINGLLILLFVVLLLTRDIRMRTYEVLMCVLVLSIAIGVHGLSHLGLETVYGYNPLTS
jgi:hypothetical protein